MANYSALITSIENVIKTNGEGEITGAILQNVLKSMVNTIGKYATFAGVATTATNPTTPDGDTFYIANGAGTYTNFNNIVVDAGKLTILYYDTSWTKLEVDLPSSASSISYDNTLSGLTATDVQNAIDELAQSGGTITIDDVQGLPLELAKIEGSNYKYTPTTPINQTQTKSISTADGTIVTSTVNKNFSFVDNTHHVIPDDYKGCILEFYYYQYSNGNALPAIYTPIAFYDENNTFLSCYMASTKSQVSGWYRVDIPSNASYFLYGAKTPAQTGIPTTYYYFTYIYVNGNQASLNAMNPRIDVLEKKESYVEPLGTLDNLLTGAYLHLVSDLHPIGNMYGNVIRKNDGKPWAIAKLTEIKVGANSNIDTFTKKQFGIIKVKKTGLAGRQFAIGEAIKYEGDDFTATNTYTFFDENVSDGIIWRNQGAGHSMAGVVLKNDAEYIWLYLSTNKYNNGTKTDNTRALVYAFDSYTDNTHYVAGEIDLDWEHSFIMEGNHEIDEDIVNTFNIYRHYYTRAEKHNSHIKGKNAIVFGDSLSPWVYGLVQEWGVNVYLNAWGGARMGYEGGAGAGGEPEEWEDAWLCRDSYVQYVRNLIITPQIPIDYVILSAWHNAGLDETDATEVAYVADNTNKRWYDSSAGTDPWASLSSANKERFKNQACAYACIYSLCKVYPYALPVIATHYRDAGSVASTLANFDSTKFATALFNGYYADRRTIVKGMADKLGGLFIDAYVNSKDSVANIPAYHSADGIHPTTPIHQDYGNVIGHALNQHNAMMLQSEYETLP